jgi:hypothetical protein
MSSTFTTPEHPNSSTQYGGDGSYDSAGVEKVSSLRVRLGEQLDRASRESLDDWQNSSNSLLNYVRRNPLAAALAIGAIALAVTTLTRRANRH